MVSIRQRRGVLSAGLLLALVAAQMAPQTLRAEFVPLAAEKAAALRSRFEARQRETRTWSAGFSQILALAGIVRPVVSEGVIRYQAPDQLRIDFTKPAGEFSLVVGDRVFLQKPGKPLAVKSLREDSIGKPFLSLLGLLQGRPAEDEANFDFEVGRDGDAYVIVLTRKARAGNRLPKRITNQIWAETLDVRESLVELPTGGTLTYRFQEATRNKPLPEALFTPPPRE